MRVVAALGGNALLKRGELADVETQRRNVASAVKSLAILAREHELVVTHGNGPQVGLLALQAEAYHGVRPYPLDVLGAETEGMVGYMIEQGLRAELPDREAATLLTQVIVDADDPAFGFPSKPIGPLYEEPEARVLAQARGWTIALEGRAGAAWSPRRNPSRSSRCRRSVSWLRPACWSCVSAAEGSRSFTTRAAPCAEWRR